RAELPVLPARRHHERAALGRRRFERPVQNRLDLLPTLGRHPTIPSVDGLPAGGPFLLAPWSLLPWNLASFSVRRGAAGSGSSGWRGRTGPLLFFRLPWKGRSSAHPRRSSRKSQSLVSFHSRLLVVGEMPRSSAISSCSKP